MRAVLSCLLLAALVGCGPEDRYAADPAPSSSAAATATTAPDRAEPPVRVERLPLLRCLHASTVPAEDEPLVPDPDPDPGTELEPRFWLPLYVECEPGRSLLD